MKHFFLVATLLATVAFTGFSQEKSWGIKAGYNLSNVTSDSEVSNENEFGLNDPNTRSGFHVGVFSNKKISDGFGIGTELLYSQQGTQTPGPLNSESEFKLDYLSAPITARFFISDGFNIYSGIQPGMVLKARQEFEGGTGNTLVDVDLKEEDRVKDFDFSIPIGLGYNSGSGLSFDARYNLGLTAVFEGSDSDSDFSSKNRVLQVGIGYNIGSY